MVGPGGVKQYPHELWVLQPATGGQNSAGDYTPTVAQWVRWAICRAESNSQGQLLTLADQTTSLYDWLIQLPKATYPVTTGVHVEVRTGCEVRASGTAKRFSTDQLHCRLWV